MRILIPIGAAVLLLPVALAAYREGPLPNMTGGFGDPNCRACHFDGALNAPGGRLALGGVPSAYVPGRTYPVTVTLRKNDLRRGGFEIVARFASGSRKGKQAGAWIVAKDGRLQMVEGQQDPALLVVQHTTAGSAAPAPGAISWTLQWIAPVSTAPVQFNLAANAANDDASPLGDFIYLTRTVSRPRAKTAPSDLIPSR